MRRSRVLIFAMIMLVILSVSAAAAGYDGYLIKFKTPEAEKEVLDYMNSEVSLFSDSNVLEEVGSDFGIYKTYDERIINALNNEGLIENIEPNYECQLFDYNYTAEPKYSSQWAHEATNVEYAWNLGIYGNNVNVAVIDSGLLDTHEDFTTSNLLPGYNFTITNTADLTVDATDTSAHNYHGTGVASVIAAAANGKGCVGVAHRANIIPVKVYGYVMDTSTGTVKEGCYVSDIIDAVSEAYYLGADVINMSLGYVGSKSSNLESSINNVELRGTLVVAAAGNLGGTEPANFDGNNNYNYAYPASLDNVVSVANIKNDSGTYSWSEGSRYNDKVTIAAPGSSIVIAYSASNGSYATVSGTSFASPYIAGVAALAKSVKPDITQEEFTRLLTQTANKTCLADNEERNDKYGYGIVDVEAFIKALIGTTKGFISPVDRTESGTITVKIFNPNASERNVTMFAKTQNSDGKPLGIKVAPVKALGANSVVEADITGLTNASTADITCYLLDSLTFEPLYQTVIG